MAAEIDRAKLPELSPSTCMGGRITQEAARLTGLAAGTPVAVGAGDGAATTHGSGVFDEKNAYLTVGSSAWVAALSAKPCIDPGARAFNYVDMDERLINVCGTVQCASTALDYMLRDVLSLTQNGEIDFALAESLCLQAPPGANGLFFLPTLMGERCPWWDPKARGALFGLTLSHSRADMVRAIMEGTAFALRTILDEFHDPDIHDRVILGTGGGYRSRIWSQIKSDILNCTIRVHQTSFDAALAGNALLVMRALGYPADTPPSDGADAAVYTPDPALRELYEERYDFFRRLFAANRELFC